METRCYARRLSDQWHCIACRLTWDANDPEPPACNRGVRVAVSQPANDYHARPLEFASGQR